MEKVSSSKWARIGLISFFTALTSCGGGGGSQSFSSSSGGSDAPAGVTPSEFYVVVGNDDALGSHMRTVGSFSQMCSIPLTTTSVTDLECLVDVPEGNLNFNGIEMKYNVPLGMCSYLRRSTYWFYNRELGFGPTSISIEKDVNTAGAISRWVCSENGGPLIPCANLLEVTIDPEDDKPTCVYDRTAVDNGENCCFGDYTYSFKETNTDSNKETSEFSEASWGGDVKNCIGGAGKSDWNWYAQGIPVPVIERTAGGVNATYKVQAPIQVANGIWNISAANYYTPALHTHDGYIQSRVSNLPYFIDPIDDRSGDLLVAGNSSYTFECLDTNYEIKHRIRVAVREWDLYTDYLAYIASSGATAVPDRPQKDEPTDCDGIAPSPCNDRWDLDDFINEKLLAPYNTSIPATRANNFPFIIPDR
jgi:hypothetical protein